MQTLFGTTDTPNKAFLETSKTLLGAKRYATKHKYKNISKKVGLHTCIIAVRTENNKWLTV